MSDFYQLSSPPELEECHFKNLKRKIVDEKLMQVNLQIDQLYSSDDFLKIAFASFKEPVTYDELMPVARIISTHTEADSIFN